MRTLPALRAAARPGARAGVRALVAVLLAATGPGCSGSATEAECAPPGMVLRDGECHAPPVTAPSRTPSSSLVRSSEGVVLASVDEHALVVHRGTPNGHFDPGTPYTAAAAAYAAAVGYAMDGHLVMLYAVPQDGVDPAWPALRVARSSDDGVNFESPRRIDLSPLRGVPHGRLVRDSQGRMFAPMTLWFEEQDKVDAELRGTFAGLIASDDAGVTWSMALRTARGEADPVLAVLPDDQLWMLARGPGGSLDVMVSHDRGFTWTRPASLGLADPATADLATLDDGRLMLAFLDGCDGAEAVPQAIVSRDGIGWGLPRRRSLAGVATARGYGVDIAPYGGDVLALAAPVSSSTGGAIVDSSTVVPAAARLSPDAVPELRCAEIGTDRQLFLDEELVAERGDTKPVWHTPKKTGEILIRADRAWESNLTADFPSVIAEGDRVRLYYTTYAFEDAMLGDNPGRTCMAESVRGGPFVKPELGLVTYAGSTRNNIVFPVDPAYTNNGTTVFVDPPAPPEARYGMFGVGDNGLRRQVSPDGLHFTRLEVTLPVSSDTQNVVYWDQAMGRYHVFLRGRAPVDGIVQRNIRHAQSADLVRLGPIATIEQVGAGDPPDSDLYSSAAGKNEGASPGYLMFVSVFNHPKQTIDVQLAFGRDAAHYTRVRSPLWLPLGPDGAFDSASIYQAPGLVREGDEHVVYYDALDAAHDTPTGNRKYAGVISRARIRFDGFRELRGGDHGTLRTIPLRSPGGTLHVNAVGKVAAEILDARGRPLPGFGLADCVPFSGDSVDGTVRWAGAMAIPANTWFRVHFVLENASLYSFQVRGD